MSTIYHFFINEAMDEEETQDERKDLNNSLNYLDYKNLTISKIKKSNKYQQEKNLISKIKLLDSNLIIYLTEDNELNFLNFKINFKNLKRKLKKSEEKKNFLKLIDFDFFFKSKILILLFDNFELVLLNFENEFNQFMKNEQLKKKSFFFDHEKVFLNFFALHNLTRTFDECLDFSCSEKDIFLIKQNGGLFSVNFDKEIYTTETTNDGKKFEPIELLSEKRFTKIKSGKNHSICLNDNNEIFSFGLGLNGQLGYQEKLSKIPKKIEFFDGLNVTDFEIGSFHTFVVVDEEILYSFGAIGNDQLGKKEIFPSAVPVEFESNLIFSSGDYHTVIYSKVQNKMVFTCFGLNEFSDFKFNDIHLENEALHISCNGFNTLILVK
ncbi:hypothetical protein HDU92_005761 [Lobulomyces angularis]|nr:hypothetical protein HDU92_005761 [Lobulomyces angularis]